MEIAKNMEHQHRHSSLGAGSTVVSIEILSDTLTSLNHAESR